MARSHSDSLLHLARLDFEAFQALRVIPQQSPIAASHAQQAVEKSLKAVLHIHAKEYPRTHNLVVLLNALSEINIECPASRGHVIRLIPFAVEGRYDEEIDSSEYLNLEDTRVCVQTTLDWAESFQTL